MRALEVRISSGHHNVFVSFYDAQDIAYDMIGRVYQNPTITSFTRLINVINDMDVTVANDGYHVYVFAKRKEAT
jgi:hypothetical protein